MRSPLNAGHTGYRQLVIAKDGLETVTDLVDPDGTVKLVPKGWQGVEQIGMVFAVSDLENFERFIETYCKSIKSVITSLVGARRSFS